MRPGDYNSKIQAENYHKKRFVNGLEVVNQDEMDLLRVWLSVYSDSKKSKIYLDMGTGTGRLLRILFELKPNLLLALDNSQAMLDYLKQIYIQEVNKKTLLLIRSQSNKTTLVSNSINIITSFHLMKHLENIEPTIKESYRILQPAGLIIFDILNKNSLVRLNLETCFALNENQIRDILQNNGFKIIEMKYMHTFGETIYRFLPGSIGIIFRKLDKFISNSVLRTGTKIFILAQKL